MNKYAKSYVYGIKCFTTEELYIGSSYEPPSIRLAKHKTDLKGYLGINNNKPRNYRSSFEVLMNDNYKFFKIEDCECTNKEELEIRETLYILKNKVCNKRLPRKINVNDYDLSSLVDVSSLI